MKKLILNLIFLVIIFAVLGTLFYYHFKRENQVLKEIIFRLEADTRIAQVLVTAVKFDEKTGKKYTAIKFLEYDIKGRPLQPKYFIFSGNMIQFQSLVIRFDDMYVKKGDRLRGKSAYLFWKVFMLNGPNTEEYDLTEINQVPDGYKLEGRKTRFEQQLWSEFWKYALNPKEAQRMGIKNAQIEAPGMVFVPGMIYTIKIEHDGGMRIDVSEVPPVLRGEKIP
jgi:hypothetical protein